MTGTAIAKRFGITTTTVWRMLHEAGAQISIWPLKAGHFISL